MKLNILVSIFTCLLFLGGCSASYKQLSLMKEIKPQNFQDHLLTEYKKRATFEADKMHDWNSAKLYSEKALRALENDEIYPEEISYWKLPNKYVAELRIAHDNLMTIYDAAKINDPLNLARAISSLDCWSEQQEENWQIWDINSCKKDFLDSMHNIYEKISNKNKNEDYSKNKKEKKEDSSKNKVTVITKNKKNDLMQIIYFDFDKFNLSDVSKNKIKLFVDKYGSEINQYILVGHTDTKGSKSYNMSLSIKRAKIVQELLLEYGIKKKSIKILGKGEESLAVNTPDETRQPANRRVEIKKTN